MISIKEFIIAMEAYGAKRLYDRAVNNVTVPAFEVAHFYDLVHSGTYYVITSDCILPTETVTQAMTELGETYPGDKNFWYGEIHSVRGLLTLSAMLDGKYTKELVDNLINETYKKILDCCSSIKSNQGCPYYAASQFSTQFLRKLLEYNDAVNPFANKELSFLDPADYVDTLGLSIDPGADGSIVITLSGDLVDLNYHILGDDWVYSSSISFDNNGKKSNIFVSHYSKVGKYSHNLVDEVIQVSYKNNVDSYDKDDKNFDLSISIKNETAWEGDHEELSKPVTKKQVEIMLSYLNTTIKEIQQRIISHMTK